MLRERRRNFVRRAGHDDGIERRDVRPALVTVANFYVRVFVIEPGQSRRRVFRKRLDDFNCVNIFDQFGQNGRLVTRAGANFENAIGWLRAKLFGHERDNEWLRNRLIVTDWERAVPITFVAQIFRHEFFPRHFGHRRQHALVVNAARLELFLHHLLPLGRELRCRRNFLVAASPGKGRDHQP